MKKKSGFQIEQRRLVQTETRLFAAGYTDPWQNPSSGLREAVACIGHKDAWAVFEPRVVSKTAPFMVVFEAEESDPEPTRRFLRYRAAAAVPAACLDFARILSPALTISLTGTTGEALISLTFNAPRQSAVNPDITRRRGCTALAGGLQSKFHDEFERQITAKQAGGNL
ncbi:MAG: hypothetical protein LBH70_04520 [Spirochaetaceae bacterium]|jgi:hypothetical protein|nr:hypothetical protein [Spirochaetaceae bacterium]